MSHRLRQTVRIYSLPTDIKPGDLAGGVAVVIDVLRASTTIVVALANGAARILPCSDVETARRWRADDSTGNTLAGGERKGLRIEGFDLDNSPGSYSRKRVEGKTITFTTTNGTAALMRTEGATQVLIGALVNRKAIVNALQGDRRPVHLICAGTDGETTTEDLLGAAAIAAALAKFDDVEMADDQTDNCVRHWPEPSSTQLPRLVEAMRTSKGGRNLVDLGFDQDIVSAAQIDSIQIVPEYSIQTRSIQIGPELGIVPPA